MRIGPASAIAVVLGLLLPAAAIGARREDPAVQSLATQAYMARFGVSEKTARSRLARQDRAAAVESDLAAALGSTYGGSWLDPADGGRMRVGLTAKADRARASQILAARKLRRDVRLVRVRLSLKELREAHERLDAQIRDVIAAGKAQTAIDAQSNAVAITTSAGLTAAQSGRLRAAAAALPVTVAFHASKKASLTVDPLACNLPDCSRPLRGGVYIYGATAYGDARSCTAGFMVRRAFDGKTHVVTAGHCLHPNGGVWIARDLLGLGNFPIGTAAAWEFDQHGGEGDAGIIVVDPGYWTLSPVPGPFVVVDASPSTTYQELHGITATGDAVGGQTLCFTGAVRLTTGHFSTCGTTSSFDVTVQYTTGETVKHLVEMRMCGPVPGDSGGPVFKSHVGYGILLANGGCYSYYQPIRAAARDLGFTVLTG
jgi:hypothetical protein